MTHHPGRPDATPDATLSFNLAQSPSLAASPDAGAGGSLPPTPVMPYTSYQHDNDDGSSVGADVAAAVTAARSAMAAEIAAAREEEAAEAAAAIGALEVALATATARVAELEDQDRVVSELRVALEQADTALAVQAQDAAAAQAQAVQDAVKDAVAAAVEERDTHHEEALAELTKEADNLRAAVASATASRDAALLQASTMAMAVDNQADDSGGQAAYAAAATAAKLEAQLAREKEESERLALELAATGKEKGKLEAKLASQKESHARELKELREDLAQSQQNDDLGGDNANMATGDDHGDGQRGDRRGRRGASTTGGGTGGGGGAKYGGARGKSRGRSVLSRSPSIDPISRMVAQLPERERTAHLATELVAAQERAKAKEVAVAAAEKDAKSLRAELALLKAAKTESDRKLAALMAYNPASARKAQAAAAAAASSSTTTAASKQAGFPRGNDSNGGGTDGGEGGNALGGDGATEAARADAAEAALGALEAEVEGLKAAKAAAEETAALLREELDEAQEDAALLKQLNEMDQLTIGSLQQGGTGSGRASLATGGSASGRQSRDNNATGAGATPALATVDEGSQSTAQQQLAEAEAKVVAAEAAATRALEEATAAAASASAAEARASAAEVRVREAEARAASDAKAAAKAKKELAAATAESNEQASSKQSKAQFDAETAAAAKKSAAALLELEAQAKRDESERHKLEKAMKALQRQLVEAEQEIYAARADAATAHSERAAALSTAVPGAPGGASSSASSSSTSAAGPRSLAWDAPVGAEENESFWAQEETRLAAAAKTDPLENVGVGSQASGQTNDSGSRSNARSNASSMAYTSAAVLGKAFFGQQASAGDHSSESGSSNSASEDIASLQAMAPVAFEVARVSFARTSPAGVQGAPSNGAAGLEAEATGGMWREVGEACTRAELGFLPVGLALNALAQQVSVGGNASGSGSPALPAGWNAGPASAAGAACQAVWSASAAAAAGRVVSAELARRGSSPKAAAEDGSGACVPAEEFVDLVAALHANAGGALATQAGKSAEASDSTSSSSSSSAGSRAAELNGILKDVAAHDLAVWCTRRLRQHERAVVSQSRATAARLAAARSNSSRKGADAAASASGGKVEVKVVRAVRLGADGNPCEGEVDSFADFNLHTAGGRGGAAGDSQSLALPPWSKSPSSVEPPAHSAQSGLSFSVPPSSSSSSRRGRSSNANAANLELSGVLTARSATADDAALGSFVLPLSDLASRLPTAAWGQRWCTAEVNSEGDSNSSGAVLLLLRVRLLPSPEASLATELRTARKVLKNLVHAREGAYLPLANDLATRAVVALRRRVTALMAKTRGQPDEGASLLQWWQHDLSPQDRQAWLGGAFAVSGIVVALAAGTPSHSWLGRRARALVLLVQAAATWEFADRMGDGKAGWAAAAAHTFGIRASFFTMASAVVKVAVTAAIFHGMLVLLGASGGSGGGGMGSGAGLGGSYYSADALTPLLWVWFFGVVTGHLVFGRMQQQEALDFLRVDMEEARAALAKVEAEADALADEAATQEASSGHHNERLDASRHSFDSALDETAATNRSLLEGDSTVSYTHHRDKSVAEGDGGGVEEWKAGAGEEGFSEDSTVEGEVGSISEVGDRSFRR